jgi:hypothetical protein
MIFVFKTSLSSISEVRTLKPLLDNHYRNAKWNVDLEDCDNILRIDNPTEIALSVTNLLQDNGFDCEELAD